MAQAFDLKRLADRLSAAADRIAASPAHLRTEVTPTDLIVAAHGHDGGHGRGRTESLAFGILFHDDEDRLAQGPGPPGDLLPRK
ncbi:hypothetical protein [Caulobacter sp. S45]|uniref:hypothetical protein n=1 Tax=Caulobacter sp. S45 TaxID=1641861 RepID=UPI00131B447D|nr:hypothetical protein [Caulobacter sp. S45]